MKKHATPVKPLLAALASAALAGGALAATNYDNGQQKIAVVISSKDNKVPSWCRRLVVEDTRSGSMAGVFDGDTSWTTVLQPTATRRQVGQQKDDILQMVIQADVPINDQFAVYCYNSDGTEVRQQLITSNPGGTTNLLSPASTAQAPLTIRVDIKSENSVEVKAGYEMERFNRYDFYCGANPEDLQANGEVVSPTTCSFNVPGLAQPVQLSSTNTQQPYSIWSREPRNPSGYTITTQSLGPDYTQRTWMQASEPRRADTVSGGDASNGKYGNIFNFTGKGTNVPICAWQEECNPGLAIGPNPTLGFVHSVSPNVYTFSGLPTTTDWIRLSDNPNRTATVWPNGKPSCPDNGSKCKWKYQKAPRTP